MHRAGAERRLIAVERGGQQRCRLELPLSIDSPDVRRRLRRRRRRRARRTAANSVGVRTGTGSGIGSPASAGTPRASLAARYFGGSDKRGSRPPRQRRGEVDQAASAARR